MSDVFPSERLGSRVSDVFGHYGLFLGHFGSFWIIPEPFRAIWGHIWVTSGHFGSFLAIFGHFVAFLDKFAESSIFFAGSLESRD